jgi:predicted small lipoprotein YifL
MKNTLKSLSVLALLVGLVGCSSMGNAPAGMSEEEAKKNFESQTPERQIEMINGSPMPPAQKVQRIKEIREKNNLPAEAGSSAPQGGQPNIPSTPSDSGTSAPQGGQPGNSEKK